MTASPNRKLEQDDDDTVATWQKQIAESTNPADALLSTLNDHVVASLPVADRIALAQAFYLRAAALAQAEIACQAGGITDMLGETNDALWDIRARFMPWWWRCRRWFRSRSGTPGEPF